MRLDDFQITEHFSFKELSVTSRLNYLIANDYKFVPYIINMYFFLIETIEPMRIFFDTPFRITSGFRCKGLNALVNGSGKSLHMQGQAIDIIFAGLTWNQYMDVCNYIAEYFSFGKMILEKSESGAIWIHFSAGYARKFYTGIEGKYTLIRG